jgi:hypothetical protein
MRHIEHDMVLLEPPNDGELDHAYAALRLAAIVPAEFAQALEGMSEEDARELLEDLPDAAAARQALAEPGESIPWEQVKAEAGL